MSKLRTERFPVFTYFCWSAFHVHQYPAWIMGGFPEYCRAAWALPAAAVALSSQGEPGLQVIGMYGTVAELEAAHPVGTPGKAYAVGTAEENEIYFWDVGRQQWRSLGRLVGPEGKAGPPGDKGSDGAAAGFGDVTATVDDNTGVPSITVTASGPDTAKVFNFAFKTPLPVGVGFTVNFTMLPSGFLINADAVNVFPAYCW